MPSYSQNDHPLLIQSPLGPNVLLIDRIEGEEAISALFEFRLRLRSQNLSIDPSQLIGQAITVSIDRTDGSMSRRFFNGIVTRFESHGVIDGGFCLYTAVLRPWLWLATQTTDCRIFQEQSAMDIVKALLGEIGSYPFETKVTATPPTREYCVQYNETDFAFIGRLLEDEGIYYYFRHENGKHTLVLGDEASALADSAEATVSFKDKLSGGRGLDRLRAWAHGYELRPGKWSHTDYNFKTPDTDLLGKGAAGKLPGMPKNEIFEFPGDYDKVDVGQKRATVRADQTIYEYDGVRGQSVVETFSAGCRFGVSDHHTSAEKGRRYLITMVHHEADQSGSFSDARESDAETALYMNWFAAIPADAKVRPGRRTTRPRIWGPHTALVVGPAGEEIFTDKYGRIKVQFYWDRYGQRNEKSSCWIRVAFLSAGANWGMVAIPRIGYEVVVEFIDGDPDRPLVTGCVYNAKNMPPLSGAGRGAAPADMPGAKMMSTLRSQSLGKTGGFNEITMNDTSGKESLFIKAQYDEIHRVGHDRDDAVVRNRATSIGNNDSLTVGNDRSDTIKHDRTVEITNNDTLKVHNNRDVKIDVNDTLNVGSNRAVSVGGNQDESITGNATETAQQITLTGQMKITLQCGASSIEMTPGMISINAPMVMINS
ncbi:MAG TPA: type VI secretion system tip protein TssI/VgrG [Tepidisphaeraceae bacterium]|jgi:type VI secretion system secreted protein VgrG|nr:type VI secretion system tip protein TssI/VgrG [Tepidisphaeraceae bacterium]